jgi:predicted PurR-regulated permease PerM
VWAGVDATAASGQREIVAAMKFSSLWRRAPRAEPDAVPAREHERRDEPQVVEIAIDQLRELSAVFAAPRWLRDLGVASWLLVGVAGLVVGLVFLLAATSTIVVPVIGGLIVATVAAPAVTWMQRRRVPRALGAAIVLLGLVVLGAIILLLVVGGIVAQSDTISETANAAADKLQGWLKDAGVDTSGATSTTEHVSSGTSSTISALFHGIAKGIEDITSLVFALSFAAFSTFFLLKDGPAMRAWVERHMGVPAPVARTVTGGVIHSLRRYFGGVTIVAGFNAIVVGVGAWALGVPLAGTIAVVTFVTAYVPFVGAFVSGAFAVIIALGAEGTTTALIMLVIVLLANGMLQNIVQPIAFGATLGLNPLVVLVVTIGAGSLFGMIGLVLAAPLTSAAVHITRDLAAAKAATARAAGAATVSAEPEAAPG